MEAGWACTICRRREGFLPRRYLPALVAAQRARPPPTRRTSSPTLLCRRQSATHLRMLILVPSARGRASTRSVDRGRTRGAVGGREARPGGACAAFANLSAYHPRQLHAPRHRSLTQAVFASPFALRSGLRPLPPTPTSSTTSATTPSVLSLRAKEPVGAVRAGSDKAAGQGPQRVAVCKRELSTQNALCFGFLRDIAPFAR